jgi:transcriptional regulator with XRE-family HTH domain
MSRQRKTAEEIEEAKLLGRALAIVRVACCLTQPEVAERAGLTAAQVCKLEHGSSSPRHSVVKRLLTAMGVTFAALLRAQELIRDPSGEVNDGIEDAPDFRSSEEGHQTAVRLAQEAGRAVAHCCLAFMELQAGGWPQAPR